MTPVVGAIAVDKKSRAPRKTLGQKVAAIDKRLVKALRIVEELRERRALLIEAARAELAAATSAAEARGDM